VLFTPLNAQILIKQTNLLFYLIYISKAESLMPNDDLIFLLNQSKTWNQGHALTGMLLYLEGKFLSKVEGRFIQVLEGAERDVKEIFEKIKQDPRHHSLIVLKQSSTNNRSFGTWTMGFKSIKLEDSKGLKGNFDLNEDFLKSDELQQSNVPLNFLKSFYEVNIEADL
jgi:hypothetical protein